MGESIWPVGDDYINITDRNCAALAALNRRIGNKVVTKNLVAAPINDPYVNWLRHTVNIKAEAQSKDISRTMGYAGRKGLGIIDACNEDPLPAASRCQILFEQDQTAAGGSRCRVIPHIGDTDGRRKAERFFYSFSGRKGRHLEAEFFALIEYSGSQLVCFFCTVGLVFRGGGDHYYGG